MQYVSECVWVNSNKTLLTKIKSRLFSSSPYITYNSHSNQKLLSYSRLLFFLALGIQFPTHHKSYHLKLFSLKLAQNSLLSPWVSESHPAAHDSLHFLSFDFCIITFFRTSHCPLPSIPWSPFTEPSFFAP